MKRKKELKRSGNYPCEICKEPNILQEHHIEGREIPNANHPSNLCLLCANCHNKLHWGKIIIEKWATTSLGKELIWREHGKESFTGEDSIPHLMKKG